MLFSADQATSQIQQCLVQDQAKLRKLLDRIERRIAEEKPTSKDIFRFNQLVERSQSQFNARRKSLPKIKLADDLPISNHGEEIAKLLREHQVLVIAGETGSGKTTQLPKICLMAGRGLAGRIAHTQPRRVAARTVAQRIASEIGTKLGELVGYQVRFNDQSSAETLVKLMTDGILLSEIQRDPDLLSYDTIILDEAHERSLNIDFLLGYLQTLLKRRPDLKLIITSATIDLERFSEFYDNAPILEVSGRTYPVDIEYLDSESEKEDPITAIEEAVNTCLQSAPASPNARDILIFLSGEREIRETTKKLRDAQIKGLEVLPLYSRLSVADQDKVFRSGPRRRVVLATNVAETSITVPGIGYVIDPGLARISRFSARTQIQRLPIEAISQASANQRAGRGGRIAPGKCLRLYSEQDFLGRPEFTDPEIRRTNLSAVILRMAALKFGDIRNFPFIEPPDSRQINTGIRQLQELQLLDAESGLTKIGREVANLPIDPKFGRMLWEAKDRSCLAELLIIVSALTIQDPRERPSDKRQQADEKHRKFRGEKSDFLDYLNLWQEWEDQRQELTNRKLRAWCEKHYLSFIRMREWRDIHFQLKLLAREQGWKLNKKPADYQQIHMSLLAGLLGNIGFRRDKSEYLGARNRLFHIFPGSGLFKERPKWIVSGKLLETSQLYAHQVAEIEPEWLEPLAKHLIQDEYLEPQYNAKRGEVTARRRRSLFGLVIRDDERISYKKIDPEVCHQIFVREALANGRYRGRGKFFQHNKKVIAELEDMQSRARRSDLSPTEEDLYDFYSAAVDSSVLDFASFESWYKTASNRQPNLLYLDSSALLKRAELNLRDQFPDRLSDGGVLYKLRYQFDPNAKSDGVTVELSLESLQSFPQYLGDWLVPGMLEEKVVSMLRSLPKRSRRELLPISDKARDFVLQVSSEDMPLREKLANWVSRNYGIEVTSGDFDSSSLPDYFHMNYALLNDQRKIVEQSRDLVSLKERYRQHAQAAVETLSTDKQEDISATSWQFGEIAKSKEIKHQGRKLKLWLGFEDKEDSVSLRSFSQPLEAQQVSIKGLARLYYLANKQGIQYLQKELFKGKTLQITNFLHKDKQQLVEEIIFSAIVDCFDCQLSNIRSEKAFNAELAKGKAALVPAAMKLEKIALDMADMARQINTNMSQLGAGYNEVKSDIDAQMAILLSPGIFFDTPAKWREQFFRYFKAILSRLQKLESRGLKPDQQAQRLVELEQKRYLELKAFVLQDTQRAWPELDSYRWMIEEYRISLFAQPMKTLMPVSEKRLQKATQDIETARKNFISRPGAQS